MTSSKPSPRPIDVTLMADMSGLNKALSAAARASRGFAEALRRRPPKVRHLPRYSGVGARPVLMPWRNKAARHPWAHQRDANNRVIPLVDGGGPLPTREV